MTHDRLYLSLPLPLSIWSQVLYPRKERWKTRPIDGSVDDVLGTPLCPCKHWVVVFVDTQQSQRSTPTFSLIFPRRSKSLFGVKGSDCGDLEFVLMDEKSSQRQMVGCGFEYLSMWGTINVYMTL
jgi:hypothetical protein